MWVQIRGMNPNTGEEIDQWNCSFFFLPMLLIENSHMSRQTGAAVESFRNEVKKQQDTINRAAAANKLLSKG